ncbi:response regulator transcription factor [Yersinia mollaretii]|uniref:Two-component response regulator n=2 Tax=Yersinia mollaretii TaxID=33060 RepID=A0AA36PPD4_YERMO|nr:response regulator transcription factor [Yersinia mollaretii]MDA5527589.1 response regulator transcription factor [Yersinia mollaretii]MDA5535494.1 response regulator transcription factor [Yersinia mollaretii]MDN0111397.1 response regulator transcription factor [Yersinia mollaretii]MDR7875126.1 response regulator transcription factor [Yersinia mollaretii]NIL03626.1 response regulator transcription factor [Yersinia mollaretii]
MYKVLVVDDHPFIRETVKMVLEQDNFRVIAEADCGLTAMKLARQHHPDLIVLDIAIPKMDGLEVISRLHDIGLSQRILVLTSQLSDYYAVRCMRLGATGFVSKTEGLNELSKAANAIMSGYTYFPNLSINAITRSDVGIQESDAIKLLSNREISILQYLAMGMTNKEISDLMLLSNKTISTFKTRLIEKLNVKSVVHLAELAKRNNLI